MYRPSVILFPLSVLVCLVALVPGNRHFQSAASSTDGLPQVDPASLGLLGSHLNFIDDAVLEAITAKEVPGAVVVVGRRGKIGYLRAFGQRAVQPKQEAMTTDTIFDMASLTKVMATTPSVMLLVERGKVRLNDPVKRYLPEFTGGGKDGIVVRQLLTHHSGLRPNFDLSVPWHGYAAAMTELWKEKAQGEPGREFVYSDLNFITLGEIIGRVSGQSLDDFARANLFQPLGMSETSFNPVERWRARIAPTESRARSLEYLKGKAPPDLPNEILRGSVHDPTAWRMGGVAGHAGLFSTARDVAIYAQTLLSLGEFRGKRILSPMTVKAMTQAQSPRTSIAMRGFGWDIDSTLSAPRGDLLAAGFGHTGFTGTSLWIHPPSDTFVTILSSRLHPEGKGDVAHLRGVIANIVAASIADRASER